jgi:hypothetical protein
LETETLAGGAENTVLRHAGLDSRGHIHSHVIHGTPKVAPGKVLSRDSI